MNIERETLSTTINGVDYRANKYDPKKALRLMNKIGSMMGGPLGNAIGAFARGDEDVTSKTLGELVTGFDGEQFGGALQKLFLNMEGADLPTFLEGILSNTEIAIMDEDGDRVWVPVNLNRDFRANLFDVFPLAIWVLRGNYANFFKQLANYAGVGGGQLQAVIDSLKKRSAA